MITITIALICRVKAVSGCKKTIVLYIIVLDFYLLSVLMHNAPVCIKDTKKPTYILLLYHSRLIL